MAKEREREICPNGIVVEDNWEAGALIGIAFQCISRLLWMNSGM